MKVKWNKKLGKSNNLIIPKSTPVIYKDLILVGTDSGIFYCLNKYTGEIVWSKNGNVRNKKGIISSPFISDSIVYYGDYNGVLHSLQAETGLDIKSEKLCHQIGSSPIIVNENIYVSLEYENGDIQGRFVSLNRQTFVENGGINFSNRLHGSPSFNGKDIVILGTNDNSVVSFNKDTMNIVSNFKVEGEVKYHPAIYDNLCTFGSFDKHIYCYNYLTNNLIWKVKTNGILYTRPLIHNGNVFIGSADGTFYIICIFNGEILNRIKTGAKIYSSPSLLDECVVFGNLNGDMYFIDPCTSEVHTRIKNLGQLNNTIVSDENSFYTMTCDQIITCIEI